MTFDLKEYYPGRNFKVNMIVILLLVLILKKIGVGLVYKQNNEIHTSFKEPLSRVWCNISAENVLHVNLI